MAGDSRSFWDESPENIAAHALRLYKNKRLDEAEAAYTRVVQLDPTSEQGRVGLASIAASRNDHSRAYELYRKAEEVAKSPDMRRDVKLWLGVTSRRFGRLDESFRHLSEAIKADPGNREVRYHVAMTSLMMLKVDVAVRHVRHIHTFNDADFQLLKTLLAGLKEWNILAAALDLCRTSMCSFSTAFTKAELLCWLAKAQQEAGQTEESERLLAEAIAESSDEQVRRYQAQFDEESRRNQGIMKRNELVDKELDLLAKVLAASAPNVVQRTKRALERCEWDAVDSPELLSAVQNDSGSLAPFTCITLPHLNAKECLEVARFHTKKQIMDESKLEKFPPPPTFSCDEDDSNREKKLMVGVFSADFRPHPMAPILNTFFAHAEDANLEVVFFHKEAAPNYLAKVRKFVSEFVDVTEMKPGDVASAARRRNVQVWLETTGYTGSTSNCRHLFHRPAPVVVSWAGFPGSMGADEFVHYIVADDYSIPSGAMDSYEEKPVRVPGSWLIADPKSYSVNGTQAKEARHSLRTEMLNVTDESTVVYAYLGRLWKVSQDDMDSWCRIAHQVSNSMFWMVMMNSGADPASLAADNIRRYWTNDCGLDSRRLVFSQPFQRGEHLKAWTASDVALGTSQYNSGATALDALFSGVPLVHIAGGSKLMQRVEGSLLRAVGLGDELIAESPFEYIQIAARLGMDGAFRARVTDRINRIRNEPELSQLDPKKNVVALGRGMQEAYRRYCDGEAPSEIPLELLPRVTDITSSPPRAQPTTEHNISSPFDGKARSEIQLEFVPRVTDITSSPPAQPIEHNFSSPYMGLIWFLSGLLLGWHCACVYGAGKGQRNAKQSLVARKAKRN